MGIPSFDFTSCQRDAKTFSTFGKQQPTIIDLNSVLWNLSLAGIDATSRLGNSCPSVASGWSRICAASTEEMCLWQ